MLIGMPLLETVSALYIYALKYICDFIKYVAELIFLFYVCGKPSKESLDFFYLVKYIQSMPLNINAKFYRKNNNTTCGSKISPKNKIMEYIYTVYISL